MSPDPVIAGLLLEISRLEQDLANPATAPYAARCIGTAASFVADLSAQRAEAAVQQARQLAQALDLERAQLRRELRRVRALGIVVLGLGLVVLGLFL